MNDLNSGITSSLTIMDKLAYWLWGVFAFISGMSAEYLGLIIAGTCAAFSAISGHLYRQRLIRLREIEIGLVQPPSTKKEPMLITRLVICPLVNHLAAAWAYVKNKFFSLPIIKRIRSKRHQNKKGTP